VVLLVNNHDRGESVALIRESPRLQPIVERWFSAGKCADLVARFDRFGR